ncbi:hypothetical protein L3X38_003860 [Prunus dulcis]|uniref:Uncharacterized protein n=1 Tax=Prunus dulcis TaxID=3755 RepID=A0AAD4ZMU6_PRUDU|nr:hypothetical protein L3X38_003860 [Prunus dulcis]
MLDKWKENIKEKMAEAPASENPISIKEDALTQVLGKEHPGRVRGLGFGVTPSQVDAQIQNNSWKQSMITQVAALTECQKFLEDFIIEFRQNMKKTSNADGVAQCPVGPSQSPQGNTQVPSNMNLTNAKCNLLNWIATGEVVAWAEIASTDPTSKYHQCTWA